MATYNENGNSLTHATAEGVEKLPSNSTADIKGSLAENQASGVRGGATVLHLPVGETPTFKFTVCRATGEHPNHQPYRAAKVITPNGKRDYDNVYRWFMQPACVPTLDALADIMRKAMADPFKMIVRGKVADGLDLRQPHERWKMPRPGKPAPLVETPRSWLVLDLDDISVPEPLGNGDQLEDAAYYVRDNLLPEEFRAARMVACATASTGLKGSTVARMRLFCLLDREVPDEKLRTWAKATRNALNLPVDPALFSGNQPIYTARPIFEDGAVDPVPVDKRVFLLTGDFDRVPIKLDRYAVAYEKVVRKLDVARSAAGGDWQKLLDGTLGEGGSFYEPLIQALGLAARSDASEDAICAVVAELLAERADAARQQQYGDQWVAAAVDAFRRNDEARSQTEEAADAGAGGEGRLLDYAAIARELDASEKCDPQSGGGSVLVAKFVGMMMAVPARITLRESVEAELIDKVAAKSGITKTAIKTELRAARNERVAKAKEQDARAFEVDGGGDSPETETFIIHPQDYTATAGLFLQHRYMDYNGLQTLFYSDSRFYRHNGRVYEAQEDKSERVDGELWMFLRTNCLVQNTDSKGNVTRDVVLPNNEMRSNLRSGLKSLIQRDLPADPSWMDGRQDADLRMLLPTANGLLNLRTRELLPPTPAFFTLAGVSYEYDPEATCPTWDTFIASLETDRETIDLIEEMLGYFLTTDTRFHKIFAMYGPPRSGRGTILRVMEALTESLVSVPFRQLDDQFAFQSVIGKKVLAIPDLRVGHKVDVGAVLETLISISGGDKQDIRRMNKMQWSGYLYSRIVFAANALQNLMDDSGALSSRLIGLNLTKSFEGREDPNLSDKLRMELPGILNRALDGLARLYERGKFKQPESGRARIRAQIAKTDPNVGFVDEMCVVDRNAFVLKSVLFTAYESYCEAQSVRDRLSKVTFGRDLMPRFNVFPGELRVAEAESLREQYERAGETPPKEGDRVYRGIKLADDWRERLADLRLSSLGDLPF
jgi:P4 family phage/plasmid primase-like protien